MITFYNQIKCLEQSVTLTYEQDSTKNNMCVPVKQQRNDQNNLIG